MLITETWYGIRRCATRRCYSLGTDGERCVAPLPRTCDLQRTATASAHGRLQGSMSILENYRLGFYHDSAAHFRTAGKPLLPSPKPNLLTVSRDDK